MSAGTHTPDPSLPNQPNTVHNDLPNTPAPAHNGRRWMAVFGTIFVLGAGLFGLQMWKANPSLAQTTPAAKAAKGNGDQAGARSDVVARIGKSELTRQALADECVSRFGKEVLDDLINRVIIQEACEKANANVTAEEVNQEVTRIAKRFNLDPPAWYSLLEKERNITAKQYRESVIWPMLALKKLAGEKVVVKEDEITQAFVRNYGPRVKVRMILLDRLEDAKKVYNEAKANPDIDTFDRLAQKHSVDPNSKTLGGVVPPIPRYSGNEKLEEVAFRLKPDEVSGIVEVGQPGHARWAILRCEGRTEPVIKDIGQVRDAIYEELVEQKTQLAVAKLFEELKEQTPVDNFFSKTSNRQQMMTAPATGPGTVQPVSATKPAKGDQPAPRTATPAAGNPRN